MPRRHETGRGHLAWLPLTDSRELPTAWAEGHGLLPEEILDVIAADGSAPAPEQPASVERYGLTRREREIIALVALGLRNYEVADQLGISVKTAEGHMTQIMKKLGMTSRAQLASWAVREGLLQQAQ